MARVRSRMAVIASSPDTVRSACPQLGQQAAFDGEQGGIVPRSLGEFYERLGFVASHEGMKLRL
jgi:hypothetical protein